MKLKYLQTAPVSSSEPDSTQSKLERLSFIWVKSKWKMIFKTPFNGTEKVHSNIKSL